YVLQDFLLEKRVTGSSSSSFIDNISARISFFVKMPLPYELSFSFLTEKTLCETHEHMRVCSIKPSCQNNDI
ncbi:MAG TPA: hypothetical protein VEL11_05150, partial [Candidatus Bathyarchaeia archaeon]|nr:hypothetical protein [Candidatus Bathyarchaeia archaeon]